MSRRPYLLCMSLLAAFALSATGIQTKEPAAKPEARCGLGGIVPGDAWSASDAYQVGASKVYPPGTGRQSYRLRDTRGGFTQFVIAKESKVQAVLREYDGEQEPKVLEALKARYGEPSNPGVQTGAMGLVSGKTQSRTVWLDAACRTRIEFVRQDKGMFKGRFAKSTTLAVIVTALDQQTPGDNPNPLD
ncbi:MAG TPA: hypothetical protein PKL14_12325 [Holophaga sp.]|jgi:hypothetical protein|nr:hypothetical protein [Holophaga sp.]